MSFTLLTYLTQVRGWEPLRYRTRYITGLCPFHSESTASFSVYTNDWHGHCQGCDWHGDVIGAICDLEFGGGRSNATLRQAYLRYEQLDGLPHPSSRTTVTKKKEKEALPLASHKQQLLMTALADWWHQQLWNGRAGGLRARTYAYERGITMETLLFPQQIGYAPPASDSSVLSDLSSFLHAKIGQDWYTLARSIGLLSPGGRLTVQNRLMFSCYEGELVQFSTGRALPGSNSRVKYYNATGINKYPFVIPFQYPRLEGTMITESPMGPAVLAGHRVSGLATLGQGNGLLKSILARTQRPFFLLQDNDEAGERQAQKVAELCQKEQWEYYRILPPQATKGLDEWVAHEGIAPLTRAIEHMRVLPTQVAL